MASSKKTNKKRKEPNSFEETLRKARRIIKGLKDKKPGFGPRAILEDLRAFKEIHRSK